jgi:hypothetical protein
MGAIKKELKKSELLVFLREKREDKGDISCSYVHACIGVKE